MRGKKDGAISKIGDCGVGSSWWTVMFGWKFLVVSL